jgi:MerR family transcriptional regulator, copper efflux regulator
MKVASTLPIAQSKAVPRTKLIFRIGDLAKRINKSTRAVRLYEEMNLLGEVTRNEGGQRVYGEDVLLRLTWIEKLQSLGFSLPQIKELLSQWADESYGPAGMKRLREIYRSKLEETRVQIRQLESLSDELQESLTYLDSCEVCDPCTLLGACSACEHPHSTNAKPALVTGVYSVAAQDPQEPDS